MRTVFGGLFMLVVACSAPASSEAPPGGASGVGDGHVVSASVGTAPSCVVAAGVAFDPAKAAHTGAPDALDEALARLDLDRVTLALSPAALAESQLDANDRRTLSAVRAARAAPLALPPFGAAAASALDAALASEAPVTRAILAASALRGAAGTPGIAATPATACPDPAWYAPARADAPLADALADVRGAVIDVAEVKGVPLELQRALVPIVRALAAESREIVAARGVPANLLHDVSSVPSWILGVRHFEWSDALVSAFETIDVDRIVAAGARIALVVESAKLSRFTGVALDSVDLATPLGPLVLRGPSNDTWRPADQTEAPLFLFDTGGDDTYLGPLASATIARPISIAIDAGGRDTYRYVESPVPADAIGKRLPSDGAGRADDGRTLSRVSRQGAGVLGVGLLFDLGAESDTYRSLIGSQGMGSHGVGVLYDAGGDDRYEAEGFSQGAAAWGVGLLLDAAGDDRYTIYNSGQGFGFTRGAGALVDGAGDDVYFANPGDPSLGGDRLYGSDQVPGLPATPIAGNHSFAQGCGAGHRPDWPDPDLGRPFPGGLGVLRDAAGSDRYVAGVFAQGCGFVQGLGMLLEGGGDDTYEGLYYVQGAAAHMALALFVDRAGADLYDPTFPVQACAQGLALDLSVAIHADLDGVDRYEAPVLSLGAAQANGVAVFVNDRGNDSFHAFAGAAFGVALSGDVGDPRASMPTLGVFVKAGGKSSYTGVGAEDARGGEDWGERESPQDPARGVGLDRPTGHVEL